MTDYDVVIVGAGISGLCAAYYLQKHNPKLTYRIVEKLDTMGGTWALNTYNSIRSDSERFSFAPPFAPWLGKGAQEKDGLGYFIEGPEIYREMKNSAKELGIYDNITFNLEVKKYSWSSEKQLWTISVENKKSSNATTTMTARYVILGSGYYNYESPCRPHFPGEESFKGRIIHPQHWPRDLDYGGMKVVVIGSGATSVTLVPGLLEQSNKDDPNVDERFKTVSTAPAKEVVMLQRSPTYIAVVPQKTWHIRAAEKVAKFLPFLPMTFIYWCLKIVFVAYLSLMYTIVRTWPKRGRDFLLGGVKATIAKEMLRCGKATDKDDAKKKTAEMMKEHFDVKYDPWDQRVCADKDGVLLKAVARGDAVIVTDKIERFDEKGIVLQSGKRLDCDIIVTATGLELQARGGAALVVDGKELQTSELALYRGGMMNGVPNMWSAFGYWNASWSLKAALITDFAARLINLAEKQRVGAIVPTLPAGVKTLPLTEMTSSYLERGRKELPVQGDSWPWRCFQYYFLDLLLIDAEPRVRMLVSSVTGMHFDSGNIKYEAKKK